MYTFFFHFQTGHLGLQVGYLFTDFMFYPVMIKVVSNYDPCNKWCTTVHCKIWFQSWIKCYFRCTNHQQFSTYANLGSQLRVADDHDIYEMTGCLSSCHKSTYDIELSQHNENSPDNMVSSILMLSANFPLSRYEVREQVLYV